MPSTEPPHPSTLFDLLPIGAYRSSTEGRQLRANAALVRLNGYDDQAQMLAAVNDIGSEWYVDPGRRQQFMQLMQRYGQVIDFVSEIYRHRTRERIWIRENAHSVCDASGRTLFYEGTVEDITQQRRTELALQASERRFRAFVEKSQVLTILCSAEGQALYVSPASQRLLGVAPERLRSSSIFDWVHPDDAEAARREFGAVLQFLNTGEESVSRVRHADGEWRHLAMLANNCLADPAVGGVVLNLRDVSGRVRADAALRGLNAELEQRVQRRTIELVHARDEAESANRAKSEFLSRMSHELKTPMNAILGFGSLLDGGGQLGAAQRGYLGELRRAGGRLLALIDELLDLARIDAGRLPLEIGAVEFDPLLDECLALVAPLALQHGVQVETPEPARCGASVRADRLRLKQVLLNLLSNAIKHNRRGGRVQMRFEPDGGEALRFVVGDTGPGLDAAQQARLFHAFERLGADKAATEGAGIGLALSKRLVEMMHGRIGLDSRVGAGSDFWIRLALADPGGGALLAEAAAEPALRSGTVLYIEDNAVNVLLIEAMLGQHGALRLISAPLPETGLEMAVSASPDLILLDIQLPGIDGYEVLRRLRANEATRSIPVVAISANAMHDDIERGRAAGFDDYLTKPIDQRVLIEVIARLLPLPP